MSLHVLPLELGMLVCFLTHRSKPSSCGLFHQGASNFVLNKTKMFVLKTRVKPLREFRKARVIWIKRVRPTKDEGKQEFHENGRWKPCQIGMCHLSTRHEWQLNGSFQPRQLLKEFLQFGGSCFDVHGSCRRSKLCWKWIEIHASLCMGKVWLCTIGGGNVQIMTTND